MRRPWSVDAATYPPHDGRRGHPNPTGRVNVAELPTADHLRNLPTSLPLDVGQGRETATSGDLFRPEDVRVLTMTGLGGVGKVHLALQSAIEDANAFEQGCG